jgi:hypothetical protein
MKSNILAAVILAGGLASVSAADTILDDFEAGEGRFTGDANSSGSSTGMNKPTSLFTLDTTISYAGANSQQIFIDDDAAVDGLANVYAWRLRHLSGGGTIANNLSLANGANAYIGYFLRTTTPNLSASLILDDFDGVNQTHERGEYRSVIADGEWHLYEWNLGNANDWIGFAGTGVNGAINNATVTLDSIYVSIGDDPADRDATFWIDNISFDPTGNIDPVPEPSTIAFGLLGGLALLAAKFRRR